MTPPVTAVLCGAGNRGLYGYGEFALKWPQDFRIVAACDPLEQRRDLAQSFHQIPENALLDDWRELLDREPLAHVAIVATPDIDHEEPALSLMEHGYHVLLEKPMALTEVGCRRLVQAAERTNRILTVCHVLRYAPYFQEMKRFLDSGELGRIITVRHLEPVNFWRFAHSFVRGNWSNSEESCPFILSKSCHDFDILSYLIEQPCLRVSSFGGLTHFRKSNRPADTAERCLDCRLGDSGCVYSAKRYYGQLLATGQHDWPVNVLVDEFTSEALEIALREGPYGKCVYDCRNDVVDHQVVSLEFEGDISASFTATAFTDNRVRETEIMGTTGSLQGDGTSLTFRDFRSRSHRTWDVHSGGRHLGGDRVMMENFLEAVRSGDRTLLKTGPRESVESHLMAFAAERSRIEGRVVDVNLFCAQPT